MSRSIYNTKYTITRADSGEWERGEGKEERFVYSVAKSGIFGGKLHGSVLGAEI